jgi:hypothetical protein
MLPSRANWGPGELRRVQNNPETQAGSEWHHQAATATLHLANLGPTWGGWNPQLLQLHRSEQQPCPENKAICHPERGEVPGSRWAHSDKATTNWISSCYIIKKCSTFHFYSRSWKFSVHPWGTVVCSSVLIRWLSLVWLKEGWLTLCLLTGL